MIWCGAGGDGSQSETPVRRSARLESLHLDASEVATVRRGPLDAAMLYLWRQGTKRSKLSLEQAAEEVGCESRQAVLYHVRKLRFAEEGENLRELGRMEEDAEQSAPVRAAHTKQGRAANKEYLRTGVSQAVYTSVMAELAQKVRNHHPADCPSVQNKRTKCLLVL